MVRILFKYKIAEGKDTQEGTNDISGKIGIVKASLWNNCLQYLYCRAIKKSRYKAFNDGISEIITPLQVVVTTQIGHYTKNGHMNKLVQLEEIPVDIAGDGRSGK